MIARKEKKEAKEVVVAKSAPAHVSSRTKSMPSATSGHYTSAVVAVTTTASATWWDD